ncbi:MAG: EAL domain-containing protein [Burkholderiales bacterium]|nr:EAL domain-containing protein [Burkholderiales bacterium]
MTVSLIRKKQPHSADESSSSARQLALLVEHGVDLYARVSAAGFFVEASAGLLSLLGYSFEYLAAARLRDVIVSEDVEELEDALKRLSDAAGTCECVTLRMIKSVTQTAWVELRLIRDSGASGAGVLVVGRDFTEHRKREQELTRAAAHDALTGLPNRALLAARLDQALAQTQRSGQGFAVAVADIDGFKRINDSLGHAAGDALLMQIAARLKAELRGVDTVARVGGDEFVLVLPEIETPEQADSLARRLIDSMQTPFLAGEHTQFVTISIGVALHPSQATDAESLTRCADAALYRAKDLGRNCWQLFSQELVAKRFEYLKLEHAMFEGVRNGEFLLHYQPIARTDGTVVGAEALMRWPHSGGSMASPDIFIPIAETNGLINLLGAWALRTACMQVAHWDGEGIPDMSIAVNVSPRQFRHGNFFNQVRHALAESGIAPSRLVLEITEGVLLNNPEQVHALLASLQELGVQISVDDFGTGYSSLSYLKRLPLSSLKIDNSFVRDMTTSSNDRVIVSAVLSMARELGLEVVAEGVESIEQLEFLRDKGCPYVQGYYIGKPMPAANFVSAVKARQARLKP